LTQVKIRTVGERSDGGEGQGVSQAGAVRSENAGMSNVIQVRTLNVEISKVSSAMLFI
jgi:hypothetical protein